MADTNEAEELKTSPSDEAGTDPVVSSSQVDVPVVSVGCIFFSNLTWLLFGGGLPVFILWIVFGAIGSILLLPFPDAMKLVQLSPFLLSPCTKYPDLTINMRLTGSYQFQRTLWIFPFGLSLSIIHLVLAAVYAPLRLCGLKWSNYHIRAMQAAFNPVQIQYVDRHSKIINTL